MDRLGRVVEEYLKNSKGQLSILGKLGMGILIIVGISVVNRISNSIIDRTLSDKNPTLILNNKRANTLAVVLKKLSFYIILFIGIMIILDMFNIPTNSILATAGIGGLAIGFGAQSLVKDVITGFFILLEDQYSVGDLIQTEDYEGIVEELGLRVTKLRAFSGDLHIIPNSSIEIVTNKTRGNMRALVKVTIAYEEDVDRAMDVLQSACNEIKEYNKTIVDGPTVLGISELADYGMVLNIVAKTNPMDQWALEREIRKKAKEALEKEAIEIPYPKRVVYRRNEEE